MGTHSMASKVCAKAGAKLYSLTCKLLQGSKINSDHKNNIVVHSPEDDIILDCHINTQDGCVARVKVLQETGQEGAQLANTFIRKIINHLHTKLGHPSAVITNATTNSVYLTGTFKPCDDCALGTTGPIILNITGIWG